MDKKNREYLLGQYEKSMPSTLTWLEKLENCKKAGFDYMEISIDESDEKLSRLDMNDQELNEIKSAIENSGTPILSMCLSGHRKYPLGSLNAETRQKSLEIMEKAIDLSVKLGIRIIQLAGYDVYYEEANDMTRKYFIDNLKLCVNLAAKKGVMLGFETMETPFMDTVEKSMFYVSMVNSPYLNVYPDIGNLKNASLIYNHEVCDDIKVGNGHIVAAHLKETIPNHYREIPFGEGHTEFVKNIEVLKKQGVRMFVGEFWYVGQDDWFDVCKQANEFLREKLDFVFDE